MIDDLLRESGVIELFREEAMREGRAEGARRIAILALESRFGVLSDNMRTAINQADETTLEDVVIHSADTLEQTRARLGLN